MADSELRLKVLQHFYDNRFKGPQKVRCTDIDPSLGAIEFCQICGQLKDLGLLEWKTHRNSMMSPVGTGAITAKGTDAIEGPESARFEASSPVNPVPLPSLEKLGEEVYDVFLAHNSEDKRAVQIVAEALKQRGLSPWIDVEQIPPGRWFQDVIQAAIPKVKSAAVFLGPCGLGDWHEVEVRTLLSACVKRKIPFIPVLLPGVDETPQDLVFLSELNWVRFHNSPDEDEALDRLVWGITGRKTDQKISEISHAPTTPVALVETRDLSPFKTAGMLEVTDPTYVPRECDRQLAEFLHDSKIVCIAVNGDFEIGKSSLMLRAARLLGPEWLTVGGSLGDLRSDRQDLCVGNFFRLFAPHFGQLNSWSDLGQRIVERPVLLLLDDLGEMLAPGAQAILPRLVELALAAGGKLQVLTTLPVRIDQYLRDRDLGNPRYFRPWRTLSVLPFDVPQAKHLLSLLPIEPRTVTERLFIEVERRSGLKPRPLQCLADRLWHAHRDKVDDARLTAILRDPESYT